MLNKKKVAIVALIILILIVGIVLIVMAVNGKTKVSKLYDGLNQSECYSFDMKDNENGYEIIFSKKGDKSCIDSLSGDEKTSTIVKDGVAYALMHSQKEYVVYDQDLIDSNTIVGLFEEIKDSKCTTGKEKINNKSYKYEEYDGFAGFMTFADINTEEQNVKTRFYFDKNNLAYIKTIANGEEDLLEIHLSYEVEDEIFEIPTDYAEAN